jgi:hypothetical protein
MDLLGQAATELDWIERGGVIGLLLLVVTSFLRGWIHTDREFQEERQDKLFWRDMATRTGKAAESATTLAEKMANGNPEVRS